MSVEAVIEEIIRIGKSNDIEALYLYGSRAKGTYMERSDIDIAVKGVADFSLFKELIDNIPTLYTIDILNIDKCRNNNILEDIYIYGRKIL